MPGWYDDGSEEEYQMQQAARKAEKSRERELAHASPAERPEQTAHPFDDEAIRQAVEMSKKIVTACNNYDALRRSHAALLKVLEQMIREWCEIVGDETVNSTPADTLEKSRAALANAKKLETL